MLALKKTRTVDVDMWELTGDLPALAGTLCFITVLRQPVLWFAGGGDCCGGSTETRRLVVRHWYESTSAWKGSLADALFGGVLSGSGLLVDKIIDHIPGLNRIHIDPETVQKKFGIFGEPMMVGTILGIFLGVIAGYDFKKVLLLGISIGGVMFILPRMVRILMEGLLPLSEAIKKYLNAKYPDRDDLYIGLDIAVAVGNPAIISTALLLTPISVFIAFVLPGNEVLPLGDLANLAVMASMIALASRGNIFRTVLAAIPVIIADRGSLPKSRRLLPEWRKTLTSNLPKAPAARFPVSLMAVTRSVWLLEIFNGDLIAIALVPVIALVLYGIFRMTRSTVDA